VGTLKHLYGVEADRNNAQYLCAVCAALVGEVVIHSRRIAALSRADAMTHLFEGELLGEDPLEQWKINGRTIYVFEAYRLSLS
jgi:hypothetical protein